MTVVGPRQPSAPAPDGFNIGNNASTADQTVTHLHIHLIPRHAGDREDPRGDSALDLPDKAAYWDK